MLNTESRRIATALESATDESDRRFSELFNMTTEMFEHQVMSLQTATGCSFSRLGNTLFITQLRLFSTANWISTRAAWRSSPNAAWAPIPT